MKQFVKCNISIPSNQNGLLQPNNQVFDCYNNQFHLGSHPVHPGTKTLQFVALKARKTSSLHTILF